MKVPEKTAQIHKTNIQNFPIHPLNLNKRVKIEHYFMIKMKTITSIILIFIGQIGDHTTRDRPTNIMIPKLCQMNRTSLMIILKTTIQKKIILIHKKSPQIKFSREY